MNILLTGGTGYIGTHTVVVLAEVDYRPALRRRLEVTTCYSNAYKASEEMGWQAKRLHEKICASTWHWQLKQKD